MKDDDRLSGVVNRLTLRPVYHSKKGCWFQAAFHYWAQIRAAVTYLYTANVARDVNNSSTPSPILALV